MPVDRDPTEARLIEIATLLIEIRDHLKWLLISVGVLAGAVIIGGLIR